LKIWNGASKSVVVLMWSGECIDSNCRAITDQVENSAASKGWRSLDLSQSPGPQANGGLTRPLYRTQRSSSVPVQQNPTPNALNSETHSQPVPPIKVRLACPTQHCHYFLQIFHCDHHLLVILAICKHGAPTSMRHDNIGRSW
jgi:hypothetical protein